MNTPMTATHIFYSAKTNDIIDTCTDENPPRSHVNGHTLEEIRTRYPDAVIMEWEKAQKIMDDRNCLPVREITEEQWYEMLEVLPPEGWKNDDNGESFKMMERWSGIITDIYARIGTRYLTLRDSAYTKHDEIMKRCNQFIQGE
jgi:hypothetical protein